MLFIIQFFLNLFSVLTNIKSRFLALFGLLVLGFLAGTMTPGYSFDTNVYSAEYSLPIESGRFEKGYMFLTNFAYNHGLDYSEFRLISMIFFFFLFFLVLNLYTKQLNLFVVLFSIFPFVNEATQVRNFMMIIIVLFALKFLTLENRNILSLFASISLIALSATFQTTGWMFLSIIIFSLFPKKFMVKCLDIIVPSLLIISLFMFLLKNNSITQKILLFVISHSGRTNATDILTSNTGSSTGLQFYSLFIVYILSYSIIRYIYSRIVKDIDIKSMESKVYILLLMVSLGAVGIFMLIGSYNFERIVRNAITPTLIAISIFADSSNLELKKIKMFVLCSSFIIVLGGSVAKNYWSSDYGTMGSYVPYILHIKNN